METNANYLDPTTVDNPEDRDRVLLAALLARLYQEEPPTGLAQAVLDAVKPKKPTWWQLTRLWFRRPMSIALTPARLVPVAALLIIALAVPWLRTAHRPSAPLPTAGVERIPVVLVLRHDTARTVQVIGSFNEWTPYGYEMAKEPGQSEWRIRVLLPSGRHEYAFLIDGTRTIPDPEALFAKHDGFGSDNSVIYVGTDSSI